MKTGDYGEKLVRDYMEKEGMQVIDHNFHSRFGEIDIVAFDGDILVFTEVKTRKNQKYGSALNAITETKLLKILKTGEYFMLTHELTDRQIRIDAAEVYLEGESINYLKNVYPY